ncbi:MAG: hypothetical protein J7463_07680 [Roseiflexus sp.]|jgi:hypothetical protein|nr:hypothetical protein [Roseiflexus sp.]MBO9341555.1 hypothetical protein [Roseiflexus sp.]MBO9367087.1 hypothetical protein [Roseiflexus sp.]MBO9384751.1 hypothetical protein [Roseiflexus sp.]MBO9391250.1 hypothetical protein [Roseiflexus sp.]
MQVLMHHEWQALACTIRQTPHPPPTLPTLRQAVCWIAQPEGLLAHKGNGSRESARDLAWFAPVDSAATWLILHRAHPDQRDDLTYG